MLPAAIGSLVPYGEKKREERETKRREPVLIEQTQKNEEQKEARLKGRQSRPKCIPLGSYFKALQNVFEEIFYTTTIPTDWAEAHV